MKLSKLPRLSIKQTILAFICNKLEDKGLTDSNIYIYLSDAREKERKRLRKKYGTKHFRPLWIQDRYFDLKEIWENVYNWFYWKF